MDKKTYDVLKSGFQIQREHGYKRFKVGDTVKLDPKHPRTVIFLKRGFIKEHVVKKKK